MQPSDSRPHDVISIHAPPRGATRIFSGKIRRVPFQFTPLREGRQSHGCGRTSRRYFNSRPSARGDDTFVDVPAGGCTFQFTPLREGRREVTGRDASLPAHFNSRPSARGDDTFVDVPAGGCTFQFTPLREGRRGSSWRTQPTAYFNSRPSARGDDVFNISIRCCFKISIHAPPRGATTSVMIAGRLFLISIHAPPRGATLI